VCGNDGTEESGLVTLQNVTVVFLRFSVSLRN
jgi:hypothetical protein